MSLSRRWLVVELFILAVIVLAALVLIFFRPSEKTRNLNVLKANLIDYLREADSGGRIVTTRIGEYGSANFGGARQLVDSVFQDVPGTMDWPVEVPDKAFLEFILSFACREDVAPGKVGVRILIDNGKDAEEIFRREIYVRGYQRRLVRLDERIPLERFGGEKANFVFQSFKVGDDVGDVRIIWGNPTIFAEEQTVRPHIILICIDALRRDRVRPYRTDTKLTPALGKLAEDGVVFEHAVAQSPWTLPSVASVLTGLNPSYHGAGKRILLGENLPHEELEEAKKKYGKVFGSGGKVYTISRLEDDVETLADRLRENYLTFMANGNSFISQPSRIINRFHSSADVALHGFELTRRAKEWISAHRDQLFFLYAHYMEPHEWYRMYVEVTGEGRRPEPKLGKRLYDEAVEMADRHVGGLIDHLKEEGLYEASLIIVYADHGEHLWDAAYPTGTGHGNSMLSELLEVPLIVKFPYSEHAGERVKDYVKLTDIFQTICEAADVAVEDTLREETVSLRSHVENPGSIPENEIFTEFMLYKDEKIAVQLGEYRLVYIYSSDEKYLLNAETNEVLDEGVSEEVGAVYERLDASLQAYIKAAKEGRKRRARSMKMSEEEAGRLDQIGYVK